MLTALLVAISHRRFRVCTADHFEGRRVIQIWCWHMRIVADDLCSGVVNASNRLMGHTMKRGRSSNQFHRTEKLRRISTKNPGACHGRTIRPERGFRVYRLSGTSFCDGEEQWTMAALRCESARRGARSGWAQYQPSIHWHYFWVSRKTSRCNANQGWSAGRQSRNLREV